MTDQIKYIGPSRLLDSEIQIVHELFSQIRHADPAYTALVDKKDSEITTHVTPSNPEFRSAIIDNLLHFNRQKMPFRIHFSSSLAISKKVSFKLFIDKVV